MNFQTYRYIILLPVIVLVMVSCKISKPYEQPKVQNENLYRNVITDDSSSMADLSWREVFTDTVLQNLIKEGISQNPDLQIAFTRIEQAQAYYLQSRAALLPSLDANANVTTSRLSEAQGFGIRTRATQYQVGVSSIWEADIRGKLRSSKNANLASLLQSEAASRTVQTNLVSTIANFYFALLALDQQLIITELTVMNWDTTVQTMRALKDAARVTEAAVVQSEAQRYAAEVTIPDIKQSIRETENALSILLGRSPNVIRRGLISNQQTTGFLETGVPAMLLANRPDVQQAELNFRYAFELTNVARTFFYPSLTISGSAGLSALSLSDLFDPSSIAANIGAGIVQPIFNRRANKTRLIVAEAQQKEALINFQNSLLIAGQEVSDAISLYETANEKALIRNSQLNSLQKSVEYSQELLRSGFANYTEVINARQFLLQAELGRVNDQLQQLQATVNLYRSLGGGWK